MLVGKYAKRSFLRFQPELDTETLLAEFRSIPGNAWATTYWGNIHSSVGMLLLRGGNKGNETDFSCESVQNHAPLESLPYIRQLISVNGPFGQAKYAFIFRMIASGVTKEHRDLNKVWEDMFRIHVPILTNDEAVLISDDRMVHFAPGHAWSFNNNAMHGVVNGRSERAHLIFDVPLNARLKEQIDCAEFIAGWQDANKLAIIRDEGSHVVASYPGDGAMIDTIRTLKSYGWDLEKIAGFLNSRGIPAKTYGGRWSPEVICQLVPLIAM
jgi:hypothetical protein